MEELIQFDKHLLLMLNGSESLFIDYLVMTLTNAKTWIPLYISLFYVVMKSNNTVRDILLVVGAAGLCVLFAGAVDDMIVKPTVARWRPTHDPEIGMLIDTVDGYRGGNYGFFSAHAANTFSIAMFFSLLLRRRAYVIDMIAYSLINCWTRLYLGVHYPGDITVGLLWGALVGYSIYRLHRHFATPVDYPSKLCDIPIAVLLLTIIYALCRAYWIAIL